MVKIYSYALYVAVSLLLLGRPSSGATPTTDELAKICQAMESALVDVSMEYEWYNIPPWTIEDANEELGTAEVLLPKEGVRRCRLFAAGLLPKLDPNDPNLPLPKRLLLEHAETLIDNKKTSWRSLVTQSYSAKVFRSLRTGEAPHQYRIGTVSNKPAFMIPPNLTPLGFSILRLSYDVERVPLSGRLRYKADQLVRLENTLEKVNDFDTVRADLLQEFTKQVCIRVYFSVGHGYTPVRYEYMAGPNRIALTVDVHSLDLVAPGLWFPSSGVISSPGNKRVDAFRTTRKTLVNQQLTEKHFDLHFPAGTKVWNQMKGTEYISKPAED